MPPKKKSGKNDKKAGDSSKKKAKKENGETVTFTEAVMTYQLEVKQSQVSELKEDIEDLKFRIDRQKHRNQFLKKEQNHHVKEVIEQAHEEEKIADKKVKVPYKDVEICLQEKLAALKIEESSVAEIKQHIMALEENISTLSQELLQLQHYKDHGQSVDKTHIEVLQKEMEDMDMSYAEMSDFFEKSLVTIKHTIAKQNEENITKHKKIASEHAVDNLDRHTEQEFLDNKWLMKEVEIHRRHIAGIVAEVELLEQQNIKVMSALFEQQLADVNETRKFYLTCKGEEENDLETYSKALVPISNKEDNISEDEDDSTEEEGGEELPNDLKWLDNYLPNFDVPDNQDDYRLGPMEVKLLCVIGNKMPIHEWVDDDTDGSQKETYNRWIVEKEDLRTVKPYNVE